MKKLLAMFFATTVFLYGDNSLAQSQEVSKGDYEKIIEFSFKIKEMEKRLWGVDPGSFATKMPTSEPRDLYWVIVQDKVSPASDYLTVDHAENSSQEPDQLVLAKKYPEKDTYFSSMISTGGEELQSELVPESRVGRALDILHEDFHHYRNGFTPPRRIDEGFAEAFSYFVARKILPDYLQETEIRGEAERAAKAQEKFYLATYHCYNRLDHVYSSRLTRAEKLAKRKPILESCSAEAGWEVNNASLSLDMTYAKYFFYATRHLERHGVKRFIDAYLGVPADIKNEKEWLAEFERRLMVYSNERP